MLILKGSVLQSGPFISFHLMPDIYDVQYFTVGHTGDWCKCVVEDGGEQLTSFIYNPDDNSFSLKDVWTNNPGLTVKAASLRPTKDGGATKWRMNCLPLQHQSAEIKALVGAEEPQSSFEVEDSSVGCKRITGKLKDPLTRKAFNAYCKKEGVNMTEAVEITIRHGLRHMGYEA